MKEFIGTPAPWFAVDIAGYANIQDGQYYEDNNILDAEDVGEEVVKANVKLILASHDLLQALQAIIDLYESTCAIFPTLSQEKAYIEAKQVIEKAL